MERWKRGETDEVGKTSGSLHLQTRVGYFSAEMPGTPSPPRVARRKKPWNLKSLARAVWDECTLAGDLCLPPFIPLPTPPAFLWLWVGMSAEREVLSAVLSLNPRIVQNFQLVISNFQMFRNEKKKKKKGTNQQSPSYGKSEKKIALLGNLCPLGRKSKWEYKWEGTKIPLNKAQNCVLVLCISFTPQGNSVLMFIYLITFAAPQGVWDLRSLTRDGTQAPCIGNMEFLFLCFDSLDIFPISVPVSVRFLMPPSAYPSFRAQLLDFCAQWPHPGGLLFLSSGFGGLVSSQPNRLTCFCL